MTTLSVELERLGDQKRLCSIKTERGGGGGGGGRGTLIAPIPAILPRQATTSGQSNYSIEGSVKVNVPIPRRKTFCSSVFPPGEDTVGYIEDYKRTDDIVSRCR